MKVLSNASVADPVVDRVRRDLTEAVRELQRLPQIRVIENVTLADGVETPVAHGLGRPAIWVRESSPRGASSSGRVEEVRNGKHDRSRYVVLKATGFGASVICSVAVL